MGAALNSEKFQHTIFFRILNECMALKHRNNRYKIVIHSYCINACVVGGSRTSHCIKNLVAHFPHHVARFTPLVARFPHWPVLPHHTLEEMIMPFIILTQHITYVKFYSISLTLNFTVFYCRNTIEILYIFLPPY